MSTHSNVVKWTALAAFALVVLYVVTLMYLAGQTLLGVAVLALAGLGVYIYSAERAYTYRYLFPGLLGMGVFVVLPLAYTVWVGFTNYSSSNLLTYERVRQYLLEETFQGQGASYRFTLHGAQEGYRLVLKGEDGQFISPPLALDGSDPAEVAVAPLDAADPGQPLAMKEVIQRRKHLGALTLTLPEGGSAVMAGLTSFAPLEPLYSPNPDGSLTNRRSGETLTPNFETGFFETSQGTPVRPGFRVTIGLDNFVRVFTEPAFQGPFFRIFAWNVAFAGLTVVFTLAVGMTLAVLLNWEALRFRAVYRALLFLPYAVPAFISILIFKGLFNPNFGEINQILDALFGIKPAWTSDPWLAKAMILLVNTWLGYPYMMVLCLGLLKSIPQDLYEASALDGVGPLKNFFGITAPLLMRPLTPLLIACFAFNFNNFVLIALLTGGRPDFLGTLVPAGTTDILVSYTYRIAFEDAGKNFGLGAAISTLIFILVAVLSLINLRLTRANAAAR